MNTIHLLGAEAVENAGRSMRQAGEDMSNAAGSMAQAAQQMRQAQQDMDFILLNHQRFLDGWLERFQQVLEDCLPTPGEPIAVCVVPSDSEDPEDRTEMPTMPAPAPEEPNDFEGPMD